MHKENFLFLIRDKSGVLGLHHKPEIRTKTSSTNTKKIPGKTYPTPSSSIDHTFRSSNLQDFWSNN